MSSVMSPWSVAHRHRVTPEDLDADGVVTDGAVECWVDLARSAYLEQCTRLDQARARSGLVLRHDLAPHPGGARLGDAPTVVVTASATEVLPRSFVIAVRVRPVGGNDDAPLDIMCTTRLEDPASGQAHDISTEIRDELIALEHAARHFN